MTTRIIDTLAGHASITGILIVVLKDNCFRTNLCDSPQKNEWVGHTVSGQDDTGGDNDIDIIIPADGQIQVRYVKLDAFGY
ncbi:MAG: hypothetical protein VX729_14995 [Pseudomonadota bacterium]|nr:hypothetical protein [Pseudomonadota bacterium]